MTQVPQVAVMTEYFLSRRRDRNIARLSVGNGVMPGLDVPFTPGGDDFQLRSQRFVRQFEADLIVTFSCAAMRHSVRTLSKSNLDLATRQQWPRDRCAKKVGAFVTCTRF